MAGRLFWEGELIRLPSRLLLLRWSPQRASPREGALHREDQSCLWGFTEAWRRPRLATFLGRKTCQSRDDGDSNSHKALRHKSPRCKGPAVRGAVGSCGPPVSRAAEGSPGGASRGHEALASPSPPPRSAPRAQRAGWGRGCPGFAVSGFPAPSGSPPSFIAYI